MSVCSGKLRFIVIQFLKAFEDRYCSQIGDSTLWQELMTLGTAVGLLWECVWLSCPYLGPFTFYWVALPSLPVLLQEYMPSLSASC